MKIQSIKQIDCSDWDDLVQETYDKHYCFQQQDGCQPRGSFDITIPIEDYRDEYNDSIPEVVNGKIMGVKFDVWLSRDPKAPLKDEIGEDRTDSFEIELFWDRNFYPDIQMIANDLYKKGLIEAGDYTIKIDW